MSTYCVPRTTLGALLALAHLILTTTHSGDIITIIIINIPIIQMRTLRHGEAREDPSQTCLIPNPACRAQDQAAFPAGPRSLQLLPHPHWRMLREMGRGPHQQMIRAKQGLVCRK